MKSAVTPGAVASSAALPLAAAAVLLAAFILALAGHGLQRLAVLLLIAPSLEEAIFRAGLQEALLRRWRHRLLCNVVTAVAFGVAHAALRGEPAAIAAALPALLIGALYQHSGRLRHCIVLHAAMNAAWLAWASW